MVNIMMSYASVASRRVRLIGVASLIVVVAACGSGGGGAGVTLPPDASIVRPTQPAGTDPPPVETAAPPVETAPPPVQTDAPPEPTAAPATEPADTVAPEEDGEDTELWPWLLFAIIAIAVVGGLVAAARRKPGPSWQLQATTLLDEIDQLTVHLASITPEGLQAVAQSDGMRLATMRATLANLVASAPTASSQASLNGLTAPLANLHGATDAVAMSVDPSVRPTLAAVSQIAAQLHTTSASVRASLAVLAVQP